LRLRIPFAGAGPGGGWGVWAGEARDMWRANTAVFMPGTGIVDCSVSSSAWRGVVLARWWWGAVVGLPSRGRGLGGSCGGVCGGGVGGELVAHHTAGVGGGARWSGGWGEPIRRLAACGI
jgi:hypothetical protein